MRRRRRGRKKIRIHLHFYSFFLPNYDHGKLYGVMLMAYNKLYFSHTYFLKSHTVCNQHIYQKNDKKSTTNVFSSSTELQRRNLQLFVRMNCLQSIQLELLAYTHISYPTLSCHTWMTLSLYPSISKFSSSLLLHTTSYKWF